MKKTMFKKLTVLILAAVLLVSAVGCGPKQSDDDSLQKVLDAGQLILGLDLDFPPMGFVDDNGEIVGFDIDVAEEVCNRLGVKLVKQGIDWDEKEDDLNSGKIDCIWNGFSVTPARAEAMCLSDAYMKNELILVVPGGSSIKSVRELAGRTVGVQSGSTAEDVMKGSGVYTSTTVKSYPSAVALLDILDKGEIEAALVDSVIAYYFIFSSDGRQYFILPDSLGEEEYAIGFRKEDKQLRDRIQQIMGEMKVDGKLGEISKKWFGSDITIVK